MGNIDWFEVIRFVLDLIEKGLSKDEAAEKIADKFNVSKQDILNKLGK